MDLSRKRYISGTDYGDMNMKMMPPPQFTFSPAMASERMSQEILLCLSQLDASQRGIFLTDILIKIQLLKQQQDLMDLPSSSYLCNPAQSHHNQSPVLTMAQTSLQNHNILPRKSLKPEVSPEKSPVSTPRQAVTTALEQTQAFLEQQQQHMILQSLSRMMNVYPGPSAVPPPPVAPPIVPPVLVKEKPALPIPPPLPSKPVDPVQKSLQEQQKQVLQLIDDAHGGNVTNEEIAEYLKHPVILLKENGVVRSFRNPFYVLDGTGAPTSQLNMNMFQNLTSSKNTANGGTSGKTAPPATTATPKPAPKKRKRATTTPIPAPPVLVPQVSMPREFKVPQVRPCNQWSIVTMALPLK